VSKTIFIKTSKEELPMQARIIQLIATLFLLLAGTLCAQERPHEDVYNFLVGTYRLIGQRPETGATYQGSVTFVYRDNRLHVTRTIDGLTTQGAGFIVPVTADSINVLDVHFSDGKQGYTVRYLIHSDLDNYARLTGTYNANADSTKILGLEALFINHDAPKND
jgi:hypothetical protein